MDKQKQHACPRCGVELGDQPIYLGREDEGHVCGDCWTKDRYEDWMLNDEAHYASRD